MSDLLSWAEFEFELNKTDENGITQREHLQQVERQTGYTPKALENPTPFPKLMMYIWSVFIDLNSARTAGFSGPNPITYTEIKAWKELTETPLSAWDTQALKRLDQVFIRTTNG
jgi:hypothetical protein